jgi:signal transduction histidine kinase
MSAVTEGRVDDALERLDYNFMLTVLVSRFFALAQAWGAARSARHRVRHPLVLTSGLTAISAQSAWAVVRGLRRRSVRDNAIARSDMTSQLVALVTEAASWGGRALPPDPRWSETFGVVIASWLPFESADGVTQWASLVAWMATYAATTSNESPWRSAGTVRGQRLNELLAQGAFTLVGHTFAQQLLDQARELDRARAEAVRQGERLATEREQQRHFRMIHDSALQLFEAVGGAFDIDDELLERRIEFESQRLRLALETSIGAIADDAVATLLGPYIEDLAAEFLLLGLEVTITGDDGETAPHPVVEALRDAAHEALMNVHKHAGVERAVFEIVPGADAWEVIVIDEGRGFDPDAVRSGFGMTGSIHDRLREVGGAADVRSRRGEGTHVALRIPVARDDRR